MIVNTLILFYGAVFLATLLIVEIIYHVVFGVTAERKAINRRLSLLSKQKDNLKVYETLRRETPSAWIAAIGGIGRVYSWLDKLITQSGLEFKTRNVVMVMTLLSVGAFIMLFNFLSIKSLLSFVSVTPVVMGISLVIGFGLPTVFLQRSRDQRKALFNEQLPNAIDVIVRSLRAGHPINAAMELVTLEMPDPIGTEFGLAVDEMTYGLDIQEALENMSDRVEMPDFEFMVVSISIQYETGGNLAEILENLSKIIRDRYSLKRKVKALSSEGRISAILLAVLPVMALTLLMISSPDYYGDVVDDPLFLKSVLIVLGMFLTGNYIMYRLVNFRY
ncbi:MAG: pilus assembly protein TadB [Alphaproteobacteria bacterium]|nr:MAG: pilus assembly protein TadB [Alphaproteobacteria bacterium]